MSVAWYVTYRMWRSVYFSWSSLNFEGPMISDKCTFEVVQLRTTTWSKLRTTTDRSFLDLTRIWCACNNKTVNSICSKCSLDVILKISESDMSQILDLNTTQEVTQGHPLECHLGLWHQFLFKLYSFQKVSMRFSTNGPESDRSVQTLAWKWTVILPTFIRKDQSKLAIHWNS